LDRAIIHLNVADFAVAVERLVDCRLKNRPVIIAPKGAPRGTVYDMSEEAYRAGVRKGMPLRRAVRLSRDAQVLPPHSHRYERAMQALLQQALAFSPRVEVTGGDGHLFMDVTGTRRLFGLPMDIAWRLRRQARKELDLDPIWSVAPNKLVAKVATRLVKPIGEYIVAPGEEEAFLAPLPLNLVPGIERRDLIRLQELNLTRVSQVTSLTLAQLQVPFISNARLIYEAVRGIDPSPVLPVGQKPPMITADYEFETDTNDQSSLETVLYRLVEQAGKDLRKRRMAARRIKIILDYSDGMRRIRQKAANPPTANDLTLFEQAQRVLRLTWTRRVRIRHLRLICDRLSFPPAQLELFADDRKADEKRTALVAAIDGIRDRFGRNAICMGRRCRLAL
jgi:DNA polymerase-4